MALNGVIGRGLLGLSGIRRERDLPGHTVWRPAGPSALDRFYLLASRTLQKSSARRLGQRPGRSRPRERQAAAILAGGMLFLRCAKELFYVVAGPAEVGALRYLLFPHWPVHRVLLHGRRLVLGLGGGRSAAVHQLHRPRRPALTIYDLRLTILRPQNAIRKTRFSPEPSAFP